MCVKIKFEPLNIIMQQQQQKIMKNKKLKSYWLRLKRYAFSLNHYLSLLNSYTLRTL